MSSLPEPFVSLIVNGVDVGSELTPFLLSFEWTDHLHGKADEIAVKLQDADGLWRGPWRPERGDLVEAAIGYLGGPMMPCGTYEVDVPRASGSRSGDVLEFRATSAYQSKALKTRRPKEYEKKKLRTVIEEVAARNGYQVSGRIREIFFEYKRQRRERDLAFIRRLAEDFGHFVSLKHGKLVFYLREELEQAEPVRVFELAEGTTITEWEAQEQADRIYSHARVKYFDPDRKRLIEGKAEDPQARTGDELKIDERVENRAQAEALAKGRLKKANEDRRTARLTLVGDPLLCAGQKVVLGMTFGKYAGEYLIHVARHRIERASYTTQIELKGV